MKGKRWMIVGLTCFAASLVYAWVSKPPSFRNQLSVAGVTLTKVNQHDSSLPFHEQAGFYQIPFAQKDKLVKMLKRLSFDQIGNSGDPKAPMWFNRTQKVLPARPYQYVWITQGPEPQVEIYPDLK